MPFEHTDRDSIPQVNDNWKSIGSLAADLVKKAAQNG